MILDDFRLDGQIALITGAARGLGQGMALGLAEAGADIAGVDILTMEETAAKVQGTGRTFVGISADLTVDGEPARVVQQAIAKLGRPTILVNNAGIIRRMPAEDFAASDWDQVMNVNLRAVFFLTQAVGREMIKAGTGGRIINICSMLSYSGGILVAPYTASKSAVAGITRLLGNEWAKYGINVNGIAPGYMATANTEPIQKDAQRSQEILARVPVGRWGTPQDLQGAVVFLSSKASSYITGTILRVDGGWLTR